MYSKTYTCVFAIVTMEFMVSLFAAQLLLYFIFDVVFHLTRHFQAKKEFSGGPSLGQALA